MKNFGRAVFIYFLVIGPIFSIVLYSLLSRPQFDWVGTKEIVIFNVGLFFAALLLAILRRGRRENSE